MLIMPGSGAYAHKVLQELLYEARHPDVEKVKKDEC